MSQNSKYAHHCSKLIDFLMICDSYTRREIKLLLLRTTWQYFGFSYLSGKPMTFFSSHSLITPGHLAQRDRAKRTKWCVEKNQSYDEKKTGKLGISRWQGGKNNPSRWANMLNSDFRWASVLFNRNCNLKGRDRAVQSRIAIMISFYISARGILSKLKVRKSPNFSGELPK